MRKPLLLLVVALLVALAGCGSSSTGAGPSDPASIAPAATLAYASFEINPQGPEKQNFDAAFSKLLGNDPETQLGEAFTNAASTSGRLDYATDVKPWLGDTISAVVTGVSPQHCDYALLVASTDDAKAQAAIDKDVGANAKTASYRGVNYDVLGDGTVNGVVDHFLVAGTEPAFKAVVDTTKDGNSLEDSDQWKSSVGSTADGKVGLAYIDAKGLLASLASNLPGVQRLAAPLVLGALQIHPFVATLDAQPDSLIVDVSSPGTKPDPRGPAAASSPLIEAMPADAWLAAAVPDVGPVLQKLAAGLQANPLIGAQYKQVLARVKAQTGIDIGRDVLATLNDVGIYVQGTTPKLVHAGLWLTSPKVMRLRRTVAKAAALAPHGSLKRLHVTVAKRFAAPSGGGLGDTDSFNKAQALIGGRPTVFVNFGKALQLAQASPHHKNDAKFQQALPHLRHIEYIAGGARREGQLDVLRGVVGLR
jgi:hypothetical protein